MPSENQQLTIRLLGGFQVEYEGQVLNSLSPRADSLWILFRYLLANRGKFVTSEALIDMLWHEDEVINPRKALQNLIYRLRRQLPEADKHGKQYILSQHRTYGWNAEADAYIDADEFERIVAKMKTDTQHDTLEASARRMIALYTGDYLEDIADEKWAEPYIAYYRRQYFDCINLYANMLIEQKQYAKVIEVCSAALQRNMFDEHYHVLMVQAMLAQGNRYGALTHYKSIASLLKKELGVEPSEELRAAGQSILSVSQPQRPDIGMVLGDLRSASAAAGPMFCEMDAFRQIFQLLERRNRREQSPCMLVMYTIVPYNRELPDQEMFQMMAALKRACMMALRKTDVVTQHSNTQLLALLPASNEISISIVLMRIQKRFQQLVMESGVTLTAQVRSIQPHTAAI